MKTFFNFSNKRPWLKRIFWLCIIIGLSLAFRGCVYEPYIALNVKHSTISVRNWDNNLPDIKIGVISDFHAGDMPFEKWRIEKVVNAANAENPDMVFLLGDFVNGFFGMSAMDPEILGDILSKIKAPMGVFAVTGNHDLGYGEDKIIPPLQKRGIRFLQNENVKIETSGGSFYIAGLSFRESMAYDMKPALEGIPKGSPLILLMHAPEFYPSFPKDVSVTFSGHTHGGQIRIPYWGAVRKTDIVKFGGNDRGLMHSPHGDALYITPGVGTSFLTLRLFCEPQIEIISIRKAE